MIRSPGDFISMPWKNGLGTTTEMIREELPDDSGFAWRLSMAEVSTNGEFSNFEGYDRTLLLLEGNGITLVHASGQRDVLDTPLQAARFDGEEQTIATLHQGPIRDFNLMVRRGYCSATVTICTGAEKPILVPEHDVLLVYAVEGNLDISPSQGEAVRLPAGHLCVIRDGGLPAIRCSGSAGIVIAITYC